MADKPKKPEDTKPVPPRFVGMRPELFAEYGKNRHAQKLSEEIREMRIALQKASRNDPLVNQVFRQAEYCGLNGEDTYTMLAFHLLKDNDRLKAALLGAAFNQTDLVKVDQIHDEDVYTSRG